MFGNLFSLNSQKIMRKKTTKIFAKIQKTKTVTLEEALKVTNLQIGKMSVCEDLGGGRAVQIVKVNDQDPEHSYILDEEALRCE
jgi:hypothetical protein